MSFVPYVSDEEIKRERSAARVLRASAWWKRKLSRGRCYYCNTGVLPKELTMDHLVPVIRGGKSIKSNIVTACKACNNKKKYLLPIEWDEYLSSL
jgi:5-methylcytosine-specific restriction enzyme A